MAVNADFVIGYANPNPNPNPYPNSNPNPIQIMEERLP